MALSSRNHSRTSFSNGMWRVPWLYPCLHSNKAVMIKLWYFGRVHPGCFPLWSPLTVLLGNSRRCDVAALLSLGTTAAKVWRAHQRRPIPHGQKHFFKSDPFCYSGSPLLARFQRIDEFNVWPRTREGGRVYGPKSSVIHFPFDPTASSLIFQPYTCMHFLVCFIFRVA